MQTSAFQTHLGISTLSTCLCFHDCLYTTSQSRNIKQTMRWPDWLSSKPSDQNDNDKHSGWSPLPSSSSPSEKKPISWSDSLNASNWTRYETLIPAFILTATTLSALKLYTVYLRRIPTATYITPDALGKRSIFGYVTSVGDGDTFRLYHTPGGRIMGWGWLPRRRVQDFKRDQLKEQTIQIRIAGIDSPELAHFGKPEQAYGKEALAGLRELVLGRFVRATLLRQDQYQRIVGTVRVKRWGLFGRDVGLQMLKQGHATVYEAKFGSEFGGMEDKYRAAEKKAKSHGLGLWKGQGTIGFSSWWHKLGFGKKDAGTFETPRQFKDRTKAMEEGEKAGSKKA